MEIKHSGNLKENQQEKGLKRKKFHWWTQFHSQKFRSVLVHADLPDLIKDQGLSENWYYGPKLNKMLLNTRC